MPSRHGAVAPVGRSGKPPPINHVHRTSEHRWACDAGSAMEWALSFSTRRERIRAGARFQRIGQLQRASRLSSQSSCAGRAAAGEMESGSRGFGDLCGQKRASHESAEPQVIQSPLLHVRDVECVEWWMDSRMGNGSASRCALNCVRLWGCFEQQSKDQRRNGSSVICVDRRDGPVTPEVQRKQAATGPRSNLDYNTKFNWRSAICHPTRFSNERTSHRSADGGAEGFAGNGGARRAGRRPTATACTSAADHIATGTERRFTRHTITERSWGER